MSLTSSTPKTEVEPKSPSRLRSKSVNDTSSLYHVGSDALDEDPHDFASYVNTADDDQVPATEVTRLLNGGGGGGDARTKKKSKQEIDANKKKLYSWLWKFGLISCVLITVVAAIAILAVYLTNHRGNILEGCVNPEFYDVEIDYFPDKLVEMYLGLSVVYYNHYKTVRIQNGQRYILYQCGTPEPTGYVASRYFQVPVVNTAVNDQRPVNFLEVLHTLPSLTLLLLLLLLCLLLISLVVDFDSNFL